jgi:hypothetical protein
MTAGHMAGAPKSLAFGTVEPPRRNGPHDARYLFGEFVRLMREGRARWKRPVAGFTILLWLRK